MSPDILRVLLEAASRSAEGAPFAAEENPPSGAPLAMLAKPGERPDECRYAQVRDGIAVISVSGPIFQRESWYYGGCSSEALARDLDRMLESPSVRGIILNINSPGGTINGTPELAEAIFAGRARKPVKAYVGGAGCSGAYYLAAAASEIIMNRGAWVGSIGVISRFFDTKKFDEKLGLREIEIVSSGAPKKSPDPATDAGRAQIQQFLDDLEDVFVADVARFRGVSEEKVRTDYGQGDVMVGERAIEAGLADRLGTLEGLLAEMLAKPADHWFPRAEGAPQVLREKGSDMNLKEKIMAILTGETDDAPKSEDGTAPKAGSDSSAPSSEAILAAQREADKARKQAQEAQAALDRERAERLSADAARFADAEIAANRALPAERENLKRLYQQASLADASAPVEGVSRVADLKAFYGARAPHALTEELAPATPPADAVALSNPQTTPRAGEEPMTEARRAELLSYTPLGQAILREKCAK